MAEGIWTMLKFILAVLLLPVVIASALTFQDHISTYPSTYNDFFMWGVIGFFIAFLFIYQFWGIYEFGQKIIAGMFKFISPVNQVIANILPFYLTALMVVFYVVKFLFKTTQYDHYFMFFAGFSMTMHILLVAQELKEEEKNPIKPTYFFWMMIIFILNIFFMILFMDLVMGKFTFDKFFQAMWRSALGIYSNSFDKIYNLRR